MVVEEGFFVRDHVGVADTGEDADFVEGVRLFLFVERHDFHLFQSVDTAVSFAADFEDCGVGAFPQLAEDFKALHTVL